MTDENTYNAKSTILGPKFDEEFISDGFRDVRGLLHAEKSIKSHQVEEFMLTLSLLMEEYQRPRFQLINRTTAKCCS